MYERMKADPTLANLHIIQKAVHDKQDPVVHLWGKIGETLNFEKRMGSYQFGKKRTWKRNNRIQN